MNPTHLPSTPPSCRPHPSSPSLLADASLTRDLTLSFTSRLALHVIPLCHPSLVLHIVLCILLLLYLVPSCSDHGSLKLNLVLHELAPEPISPSKFARMSLFCRVKLAQICTTL